jgi:H+/Cl- antiporter ClcA
MNAADSAEGSLLALAALALVVGALSGLIGALFRLALAQADAWRDALIAWAHGAGPAGILPVMAACAAAAAAAAAWLVRRYERRALGSGIPDVEAVLHQELQPAPFRLIPVKFFGGLLAIGGGLALGREGPSVQMVSYAAGTPGGLFAPMLALGAQFGLLFGLLCSLAFPGLAIEPAAFAVVGMAGFFTGVVRAPLTGIVLVTEMTASVAALLSMLGACFAAMLVPTLLRDPPIYDSLRARTAQRKPAADDARAQK